MALACFGPVGLLTILPGMLLLPTWMMGLASSAQGSGYDYSGPTESIFHYIWPIASLLLGVVGIVGLLSVLSIVNFPDRPHLGIRMTRFAVACGVLGIVVFNVLVGGINPATSPIEAAIYWILPLCGTTYFLLAASDTLFHEQR